MRQISTNLFSIYFYEGISCSYNYWGNFEILHGSSNWNFLFKKKEVSKRNKGAQKLRWSKVFSCKQIHYNICENGMFLPIDWWEHFQQVMCTTAEMDNHEIISSWQKFYQHISNIKNILWSHCHLISIIRKLYN